jgi:hypothetical protein
MSERWKYQLKTGAFWGLFMIGFSTFMNHENKPMPIALTEIDFYFRGVVFLLFGVFVLGYTSWKSKVKKDAFK